MTRILLVDDSMYVRTMLSELLDGDFEIVGTAESGTRAVEIVEDEGPDVVLMDILMPGIDGIQTTRLIKDVSPATTVLMVTGVRQIRKREEAFAEGADGYITKPFDPEELLDTVKVAANGPGDDGSVA